MALPSEIMARELPLPLTHRPAQDLAAPGYHLIHDAGGRRLALLGPEADAQLRARQIIQACNAFPDLKRTLRDCIACIEAVDKWPEPVPGLADRLARIGAAREALEMAEQDP